jgi:hypothetical protein
MNRIIPDAIEESLRLAKSYMRETRWATYKFRPVIKYRCEETGKDVHGNLNNILHIKRIFWANRRSAFDGANPHQPEFDIWMGNALIGVGGVGGVGIGGVARRFSNISQMQKMQNSLGSDLTVKFNYSEKTFMPISNRVLSSDDHVTIEYVHDYNSIEEVQLVEWQNLIIRLAVAITKQAGGKMRGAYTQSNALWNNNAAELTEEGNEEFNAVIAEMKTTGQRVFIKGGNQ